STIACSISSSRRCSDTRRRRRVFDWREGSAEAGRLLPAWRRAPGRVRDIRGPSETVSQEKPLKCLASLRCAHGDVAGDLALIEHAVDRRKKARQLGRELGMILCRVDKRRKFLVNQIVERGLCAEAPLDGSRGPALLNPDLLESHRLNIVKR